MPQRCERHAGVLSHRPRSNGELQGVGIEPGLQIEDKSPPGANGSFPLSPTFDWFKAFGARPVCTESSNPKDCRDEP